MEMTEPVIHGWLDDEYFVSVTATPGKRVDEMQWAVDQYATAQPLPDVVVIDLGTNDSWQNWATAATADGLDHMAAQFPDACVIFATITAHPASRCSMRTRRRSTYTFVQLVIARSTGTP